MKYILQISILIVSLSLQLLSQGYWSKKFAQVGTNNNVPTALAVDANGRLYIGGGFDYAFGVKTNYFARWTPNGGWDSLTGTLYGSSFPVNSIAAGSGNDVYVAGRFSGAGTIAKQGIVKWDGVKWDSVPGAHVMGLFTAPSRIEFGGGKLYAIGDFTKAGTISVKGIAVWDGVKWDSLGSLLLPNSNKSANNRAFTVTSDGRIYAATYAVDAWSNENVAIVKWNGTQWDTVAKNITGEAGGLSGSVTKAHVNDIAVYGDTIYVVGAFSKAGNKIANCIAKWNGTQWDSLGNGTFTELACVEVDSLGRVYAAGATAPYEGNTTYGAISRWDGKKWEKLGTGITKSQYGQSPKIYDLKIVGSKLFLCGDFKEAGGIASTGAVMYDIVTSQWKPLLGANTNGFADGAVFAYHERPNGEIFVGGEFNFAGASYARRLARWNGKTWDSVGTGSFKNTSTVKALGSDDSVLYIGGGFTSFNGVNSTGVIKWNGQKFVSMNGSGQPGSFNSDVRVITRYGSDMIIAGGFQSYFGSFPNGKTVNAIIKWDGTKYDSLDAGIRSGTSAGQINAVVVKNNEMYVAGNFTTAGNATASSIAKWNGSAWSALNGDIIKYNKNASQATITAMAFVGSDLYIAGKFDSIGTKPMWHLAKWNGTQWDTVSLALKNDFSGIADMAVDKNGRVYIVGKFTSIGGNSSIKYVARWNGSQWESIGALTSNFSQEMFMAEADSKGNIFMSGYFGYANGISSQNFAAWINDPGTIESVHRTDDGTLPAGFALEQNYPNPFNPSTTIRFTIGSSGLTSVKVYDVVGREVATLVNENLSAGQYEVTLKGTHLSSGLYFYRLRSSNFVETKKMLLVK